MITPPFPPLPAPFLMLAAAADAGVDSLCAFRVEDIMGLDLAATVEDAGVTVIYVYLLGEALKKVRPLTPDEWVFTVNHESLKAAVRASSLVARGGAPSPYIYCFCSDVLLVSLNRTCAPLWPAADGWSPCGGRSPRTPPGMISVPVTTPTTAFTCTEPRQWMRAEPLVGQPGGRLSGAKLRTGALIRGYRSPVSDGPRSPLAVGTTGTCDKLILGTAVG